MEGKTKNYINYKAHFGKVGFAYIDTVPPMAGAIFKRHEILGNIKFKITLAREGRPYILVMCVVNKRLVSEMEDCMAELERSVLLTGHRDYMDVAEEFTSMFSLG